MRPTDTDRVAWSVGLFVGLSVCHTSEPCKNVCTDRDAVWVEDSGGPKKSPMGKGNFEGGKGRPIVKYRDTLRSSVLRDVAMTTNFGTKIAINCLCVNDGD